MNAMTDNSKSEVFAMDVLRTIVLASIGSKVFWFQLKSFPFWSVAMCPHALSRIF